jgi:hypothetical protein
MIRRLKIYLKKAGRIGLAVLVLGSGIFLPARQAVKRMELIRGRTYNLTVPADRHWLDTGFDVRRGQVLHFRASGMISLQRGNPMAYCGPQGYDDFKTVQQPLEDQNIGALIGRVVLLLSVEEDEETGEEIRNELIEYFYIGERRRVEIPMGGQLFLGVNELVTEDNSGNFKVEVRRISGEESTTSSF